MYKRENLNRLFLFLFFLIGVSASGQAPADRQYKSGTLKPPVVVYLSDMPAPKKVAAGKPITKPLPIVARSAADGSALPDQSAAGIGLFTTFDTDGGLAMDAISPGHKSAISDSRGNLWFGTQGGGVSCYDGKSFVSFTTAQGLVHNSVSSIIEDESGNLWFGTFGGASRYDGKSFKSFTTAQGLTNNIVYSIYEDKSGNLWFGTAGGVSSYDPKQDVGADGKSFESFNTAQGLAQNNVRSICEDKSGNLWFGTDGGVSRYDPQQDVGAGGKFFENFTSAQGLAHNSVTSISEDKSGNLWFGTFGGGVSRYAPQQDVGAGGESFENFTTAQGLANNYVSCTSEDKNGNLWFGTHGGGVSRYNGKSFESFTTAQGLANNNVTSITEDKGGNIWFGTFGGVSRYDGKSIGNFTTAQGLANNSVFSISEDKSGNLWFGTYGGGLSRYDGKSFESFTTAQGLAHNYIFSISEDKSGNLWFGTFGGGVSRYDPSAKLRTGSESFESFTTAQGLANNFVLSIIEDKSGNLWFGTDGGGVSRYDGKTFESFTTAQGLANNYLRSISEDKRGNLWFGTDGGISRYDPSAKLRTGSKSFESFTTTQGLANNNVTSICEDKSGNLWFGTYGGGISVLSQIETMKLAKTANFQGIVERENAESDKVRFLTIKKTNGLPDNGICGISEDKKGNILIGTNFGIAVIPAKSIPDLINGTNTGIIKGIEIYNQFTGYPVRDVNSGQDNGTMHVDSRGKLWVGHGSNGITVFDFDAINRNTAAPKVIIQSVRLNEEIICWYNLGVNEKDSATSVQQEMMTYGSLLSDEKRESSRMKYSEVQFDGITRFYPLPENLILPYQHNNISFDFVGVETGRNFMVRYQYILEGYDKDWSPITKKTSANFGNIFEGTYTFKIKARSPEGIWSEPITYTFKVLPPWYRSWWMYTVYGLSAIGLIVLIVWWNGRRLRARAKELEEEVKIATLEIREQKEVVEEQKAEVERTHEKLAVHHKEITDSIHYAKRIQDAILPSLVSMNENLKDGFLMFQPKDVVAGDFYWLEPKGDTVYFAAADCTGHGVPGAMVSVVCSYALSKALLEENITNTGKLLDRTRELVIERFAKSGEEVKDGMDISLCALNIKTLELQWSGANNPLWVFSKEELVKYKPDKMPIGNYAEPKPFTTHDIQLEKEDIIYIFSDGYPDQFGGPKGKKFMAKRLSELIISLASKTMDEQKEILQKTFEDWKGGHEQVDDVCLIGVKV